MTPKVGDKVKRIPSLFAGVTGNKGIIRAVEGNIITIELLDGDEYHNPFIKEYTETFSESWRLDSEASTIPTALKKWFEQTGKQLGKNNG